MNRWSALGVLSAEYLIVSVGFEAGPSPFGTLAALGIAVAASVLVFAPDVRRSVFARDFVVPRGALVAHAAAFVALLGTLAAGWFTAGGLRAAVGLSMAVGTVVTLFGPSLSWRRIEIYRVAMAALFGALAFAVADSFDAVWDALAPATLSTVSWVLSWTPWTITTEVDDLIVGTDRFVVMIAPSCAGTEGLGLMFMFVGGGLAWFRHELRWPRAMWLLPAALVLVSIANVVRIVVLIVIGHHGFPELALGGFHSRAGWVAFTVVALAVLAVARRFFVRRRINLARSPAVAFHLTPLISMLLMALLVPLVSTDQELPYVVAACAGTIAVVAMGVHRQFRFGSWFAPALIGVGVYMLWTRLEPSGVSNSAPFSRWLLHAIVSTALVPVVEELAFRGYLLRRLFRRAFDTIEPAAAPWWSVLLSTLVFASVHGRFVAAFAAGLAYSYAYRRRGRIEDAIVAHVVTNALIAIEVLALDHWFLW